MADENKEKTWERVIICLDDPALSKKIRTWLNGYQTEEVEFPGTINQQIFESGTWKGLADPDSKLPIIILGAKEIRKVYEFISFIRSHRHEVPICLICRDEKEGLDGIRHGAFTWFPPDLNENDLTETISYLEWMDISLRSVTSDVCEFLHVPLALIWTLKKNKDRFHLKAWNGKIDKRCRTGRFISYREKKTWKFFQKETTKYFEDVQDEKKAHNFQHHEDARILNVHSVLAAPMMIGKKPIGIIDACTIGEPEKFSPDRHRLLQAVASRAAMTVNEQYHRKSAEILSEIRDQLFRAPELDEKILGNSLKKILEQTGAENGYIYSLDRRKNTLFIKSFHVKKGWKPKRSIQLGKKPNDPISFVKCKEIEAKIRELNFLWRKKPARIRKFVSCFHQRNLPLGCFIVTKDDYPDFTEDDRRILGQFSEILAEGFDREKRADHIRKIREITFKGDLNELFKYVVKAVHDVTGLITVLWRLDERKNECRVAEHFGLPDEYAKKASFSLESSITEKALSERKIKWRKNILDDDRQPPFKNLAYAKNYGWKYFICVPLVGIAGKPLGALSLYGYEEQMCSAEQQAYLLNFGNHISMAIEDSLRKESLRKINEIEQIISENISRQPLKKVLEKVAEKGSEIFRADYIAIYPYDPDREHYYDLDHVVTYGMRDKKLKPKSRKGGVAAIVRKADELIVSDANTWEIVNREKINAIDLSDTTDQTPLEILKREKMIPKSGIQSFIGISLKYADKNYPQPKEVGVVYVDFKRPKEFHREELELIRIFCRQVGRAIYIGHALEWEKELEGLRKIDEAVLSSKPTKEILNMIVKNAAKSLPGEYSNIWLFDYESESLVLRTVHWLGIEKAKIGKKITSHQKEKSINRKVFDENEPFFTNDLKGKYRHNFLKHYEKAECCVTVPLRHQGKAIGTLNVETSRKDAYSEDHVEWLSRFADRAAMAVVLSRQRENLIKALNNISESLVKITDEEKMFKGMLKWARLIMKYASLTEIRFYNPEENTLEARYFDGNPINPEYKKMELDKGITGKAARERKTQFVKNTELSKYKKIYIPFLGDTRSEIAVPMFDSGKQLLGVFNIEHFEPNAFRQEDKKLAEAFANLASVAIQIMNLYKEIERQRESQLEGLKNITKAIILKNEQDDIFLKILKACDKIIGNTFNIDILLPVGNEGEYLETVKAYGKGEEKGKAVKIKTSEGISGWVFRNRKKRNVPDVKKVKDVYYENLKETKSELAVPILHGKDILGVLNIESDQENAFTEYHNSVAEVMAGLIAVTIENQTMTKELSSLNEIIQGIN